MYKKKYHIHFVGIGGIGMSGMAELLLNLGYTVSGSDIKSTEITRRLADLGGQVFEGHEPGHVKGADVVVVSSAVPPSNPECATAREEMIPVIPRGEMLAELMRLKYGVAVAGAHGKTTTTWLISYVIQQGGLDPTMVIGGKLASLGSNARLGQGEFLVAEADESDGSFLRLSPTIAVVTNIDAEHLDFYNDIDTIKKVFLDFINKIPFYGVSVLCLDNSRIQEIIPDVEKRFVTYGLSSQADFQAREVRFEGLTSCFQIIHQGAPLGEVCLNLPGLHNVYNAMASVVVALELGIPFEKTAEALNRIEGVERRMEVKGTREDVIVVDDYGHHPTEIRMTLEAVRHSWPDRRLVVVFQPHRYSRTVALFEEFTRSFYQADDLIVLPIYAAGEKPVPNISGEALYEGIRRHGHRQVAFHDSHASALGYLRKSTRTGDIVLTLGAGDVWKVGKAFLEA
jgi:UDP-N-acetylmuramate--alanine ligase